MKHTQKRRKNPTQRGFTLVQLLIAAAILAVLAAMAYPAWQKHVRSREAEAQSLLDVRPSASKAIALNTAAMTRTPGTP